MFREFPVKQILSHLEQDGLLPAILFRSARTQCDTDVEIIGNTKRFYLGNEQQIIIRGTVSEIITTYKLQEEIIYGHSQFQALVSGGVGAHHAGQLLAWRLLLEELMLRGYLRLLVATGTVAAGVDFPARTVVITSHSKRGQQGFRAIASSELQQMAGRAGRRGKDKVGVCLVAPSTFSDARVIHEVSKTPPEPLRSAYFAAPSTVLNLLKFRNVDDLEYTVSRSLASFIDRKSAKGLFAEAQAVREVSEAKSEEQQKRIHKKARRLDRDAEMLENRQIAVLRESLRGLEMLGFVDGGSLTAKGSWAAELCTSLVIELAQAVEGGLFDDVPLSTFVGLIASISADPHRQYFALRENPIHPSYFKELQKTVQNISTSYTTPLAEPVKIVPDAALTVITWLETEKWQEFASLIKLANATQGDVARLITQTADHLNQMTHLTKTHPHIAELANEGRKRLLRPPLSDSFGI